MFQVGINVFAVHQFSSHLTFLIHQLNNGTLRLQSHIFSHYNILQLLYVLFTDIT